MKGKRNRAAGSPVGIPIAHQIKRVAADGRVPDFADEPVRAVFIDVVAVAQRGVAKFYGDLTGGGKDFPNARAMRWSIALSACSSPARVRYGASNPAENIETNSSYRALAIQVVLEMSLMYAQANSN